MATTQAFFTTRQDDGYTIIEFLIESLMNPIDLERVGQSLYLLIDRGVSHRYLLDFTKVKYLSSQAIGVILTMNKKLAAQKDGSLVLCGVGPQLLQLLKITRLDKLLTIKPTQADVLKA